MDESSKSHSQYPDGARLPLLRVYRMNNDRKVYEKEHFRDTKTMSVCEKINRQKINY